MDDLINMMISDQSPSDISDKIKEILMQKSAEKIEALRPVVASSMFGTPEQDSAVGDEESTDIESDFEEEEYREEE